MTESTSTEAEATAVDTGLMSLCLIARFLHVPADPGELARRHLARSEKASREDLIRIARRLGLKSRAIKSQWERLARTPLPAIAERQDGSFYVASRFVNGKVLVHLPGGQLRGQLVERSEFEKEWSGRLVLVGRRASLAKVAEIFDLRWFASAVHRYRRIIGEVVIASFFLQTLGLVSPLAFQVVVDKVLVHRSLATLDVLMIGLMIVAVFEVMLGGLRTFVFSQTTNKIDVELGARLFDHLMALPMAYFANRRVGDSVARVRELENIRTFITGSALTLTIDLLFTFIFFGVMFLYSPLLTWIVLGSLPLYVLLSLVVTPIFRRRLNEKFQRGADNQAFLVESVTAAETVKAMAVEPQMRHRWEEQLAGYVRASYRAQALGNIGTQVVQFINKATIVLTLYFGAKAVIAGDMTVGELVAFNMLAARVAQPVLRIAQLWQDFQQTRISVARLGDILNTPRELAQRSAASLPNMAGTIEFERVTFRYRLDGPAVLTNVSLQIGAGQMVGIVGASGSGKSTMARLVQRLYTPESGRVLVDGVDLAMIDITWLRRQIGVVLQQNVLFNCSVRENIALADPGMPLERVIGAARLAGAHEFILELPHAYDTIIGERGASLSGGQCQRIAIARALIANPRILIFDEATSALDYESERIIQENMRRIAAGRTVIVIAHRLSTVRDADRIITLDRGTIVEDGSHEDLLRRGGRYAQLHRIQAGRAEVACVMAATAERKLIPFPQRRREEREFLPAALEIVETPVSPTGRIMMGVVCLLVLVAVGWACVGRLDIVATATARLVPSGQIKLIQPLEIGVVKRIAVTDGDRVAAGDVLVELDTTSNLADRDRLTRNVEEAILDISRLNAFLAKNVDAFKPPAGTDPALAGAKRQQLVAQLQQQGAKLDGLDQQIMAKIAECDQAVAKIAKLDASIPLLQDKARIYDQLVMNQLSSRIAMLDAERQLSEAKYDRVTTLHQKEGAEAQIAALTQQRKEAEEEFRRQALDELGKVTHYAAEQREELVKAQQRAAFQVLRAPVNGTVEQLAVHTIGGVVTPAQTLMVVVPNGSALEVEAILPNRDAGFVHAGQPAELKVEAFNYTRYGLLHGQVRNVSRDALRNERDAPNPERDQTPGKSSQRDAQNSPPPETGYVARVSLSETSIDTEEGTTPLEAGMVVSAEIKTGERSVISYLLSPLMRYRHEALRER